MPAALHRLDDREQGVCGTAMLPTYRGFAVFIKLSSVKSFRAGQLCIISFASFIFPIHRSMLDMDTITDFMKLTDMHTGI